MPHIIECPSGLTGQIRGLKVREERILTDRKLAKSGGIGSELLKACWENTLDAGPYDFPDGKIDWSKVLRGDRFFTLLEIRVATYGPEFAFAVACRELSCRSRIEWELDLRDLPVQKLSEKNRERFSSGNRFETRLPDAGNRLWFRLPLGEDEPKIQRIRQNTPDRLISNSLSFRCLEVEGVEPKHRCAFFEELSMADADFLREEFDRVDCGVHTGIEIECPHCFAEQTVELPFDQAFSRTSIVKKRRTLEDSSTSSSSTSGDNNSSNSAGNNTAALGSP